MCLYGPQLTYHSIPVSCLGPAVEEKNTRQLTSKPVTAPKVIRLVKMDSI